MTDETRGRETRKLQVVGGSTYAISLPKHWVEVHGLRAGDELLLHPRPDGSVLVAPLQVRDAGLDEREIDAGAHSADELLRLVIACYACGTDIIFLRSRGPPTPTLRRAARQACARLPGLQVVEERANGLVLQDLVDARDLSMKKGLRMMHLNARRMLQCADELLAPTDETAKAASDIERCEAELDRLLLLLVKQHHKLLTSLAFSQRTEVSPEESLAYMFAAQYLERVGDYAHRVATDAADMGPQERVGVIHARLHEALRTASGYVDKSVRAFQRNDPDEANRVIEGVTQFSHDVRERALELLDTPLIPPRLPARRLFLGYFSVMESAERIALYAKSLAEVAINKAVAVGPLENTG